MISANASEDAPELYAEVLIHLADTVFMTDAEGRFTFVCPNALEMLGYTQAEIQAMGHIQHLFGHGSEVDLADLQREQRNFEAHLYDKHHRRHDLLIHIQAVTIGAGRWLYTCRDISDRKQAEQALSQLNQQLESQVQQRSQELAVFHRAVDAAAIVAMTDANGVITFVNDRFCEISGYSREELLGQTHRIIKADHHPPNFFKTMWDTITQGQIWRGEVCNRHKDGHLYWMDTAISPFLGDDGQPVQYLAIRFDITHRKQVELALHKNLRLLTAISQAQTQFITLTHRLTIFDGLLNTLLELTNSEYGFIGEVLFREDGTAEMEESLMKIRGVPYLKSHSITNIAWNEETQRFYEANYEQGMEFTNMKTLFGAVIMTGKPVIANSPATDPRRGGIPAGHPPLRSFLGLPFFQGNTLMGMVGIANCPGGYQESLIQDLQPFLVTCSILIEGYRLDRQRRQTEAQLHQTNEELARATRLKDEFLANMSHELRTPLNAVLGMTEGLREAIFGPITDAQDNALATIERSGTHLLSLINDILDLAKVESGQITLDLKPAALGPLCLTSRTFVRQQAQHKQIQLDLAVPPDLPPVLIDERRLCQVLINLLSNAVKFTPSGGTVTLTVGHTWSLPAALQTVEIYPIWPAAPTATVSLATPPATSPTTSAADPNSPTDLLYLTIADTGIGIAAANMPRLFHPFVQIDSALNRQYQGTGLGLALVKRIVALHGGSLQLASLPGVGSCFILGLPTVPQAPIPPGEATPSEPPPPDHPADGGAPPRPRVLLAAEHRAQISTIEVYLKAKGFSVLRADNGPDALALAQRECPQVHIIDTQLPGLDALDLIRHLRRDDPQGHTPILALAPSAAAAVQDAYLAAGANRCMGQPLSMQKLVTAIEQLTASNLNSPNLGNPNLGTAE